MKNLNLKEEYIMAQAENFAELFEGFFASQNLEGAVLQGTIIKIDHEYVIVDVGLKSEGRVFAKEFKNSNGEMTVAVGDSVDVYLERMEDKDGIAVLSREKAQREERWLQLEKIHKKGEPVQGTIYGRVKGGFNVDLDSVSAFLPGSQVDVRPIKDISPLFGKPQPFQILKMDRRRGNIVVSRRAMMEDNSAQRSEAVANLAEGQIIQGTVKNITDYGAFVDLGGVDGLLHLTDITWRRIQHPSEVLQIGQSVKVQVIKFNAETQRISLGMRQLEEDPWRGVEARYASGTKHTGRVTNITDYGAFVELEAGIEGLVHVSEMSWTKKNIAPSKLVSTSQSVDIVVLDVDESRRRISLGMKQCQENPWKSFKENYKVGDVVKGDIKNVTEFGFFVGLSGDIDGMVHMSDLSWEKPQEQALTEYKKGDSIEVKILDIDPEKERIALGVKQLQKAPASAVSNNTSSSASNASSSDKVKKGDIVTCTIDTILDAGLQVSLLDGLKGFIKKADLAKEKPEQRPDRFAVGEKVDAKVLGMDKDGRTVSLSVKAYEIDEQKQAMAEYGSSDSGASLGEILGAAIKSQKDEPKA